MEFVHKSIMLGETIEALHIKPDGIYVDGTLGGGGHSLEIARRLTEGGRLIGIDQDGDAIAAAGQRLAPYADRVTIVRSNYADMKQVLKDLSIDRVDGILLDLGVSSYQLDNGERGLPTERMYRLTCAWTCARKRQREISSIRTASGSFTGSSVTTGKTSLQKILPGIS